MMPVDKGLRLAQVMLDGRELTMTNPMFNGGLYDTHSQAAVNFGGGHVTRAFRSTGASPEKKSFGGSLPFLFCDGLPFSHWANTERD